MPCISPSGMSSVRPSRKPTTSAGTGRRVRPADTVHSSPTSACRPVASTTRPIRFVIRPRRGVRSAACSAAWWRLSSGSGVIAGAPLCLLEDLCELVELLGDLGVDLALGRAHDAAAPAHPALGDDRHAADAAQPAGQLVGGVADELEVV